MIKKTVFSLIAVALIFVVAACDGLNLGEINLGDFDFSEDGKQEANLYFTALNNEDFEGAVTWKFILEEQGGETQIMTLNIKTKKYGTENKVYMRYIEGETDISTINDLTDNYYIDNVAKTVTTESGDIGSRFLGIAMMSAAFGRVDFQDETEFRWDFVSEKVATVKNAENEDIETVEFTYNKVSSTQTPLEEDVILRLNFRKDFPTVVRMQFEVAEGEDAGIKSVFITELGGTVEDSDFVPPGEAQGYTYISPEAT